MDGDDKAGAGLPASSGCGSAEASPRAEGVSGDPTGSAVAVAQSAEGDGLGEVAGRGRLCRRARAAIPAASPAIPAATSAAAAMATTEAHPEGEPARAPTRHHGTALTSSNAVGRVLRYTATRVTRRRRGSRRLAPGSRSATAAQTRSATVSPMSRAPAGITVA